MNSLLNTPPVWIDQDEQLKGILPSLGNSSRLAVDTESNSLFAYHEQVCLIQISTSSADYLIDGLNEMDLSMLAGIFADDSIEKIFHAAEYDIMCLKRDFGYTFSNLFDTMQAARILGYEKIGLSNLLEEIFGIDQGKSFQKGNWGKRPLPPGMLEYARLDTHFLFKLRDYLHKQLVEKDLLELAEEDFRRLCNILPNHKDNPMYTQISGYHHLDPQQLRVLEELSLYRDKQAQNFNRPLFKVISNSALLSAAQSCPQSISELQTIKGFSPKLIKRHSKGLLAAIKQGMNLPPIQLKQHKRPSQAYINRLEALKEWRKKAALKMGVQSDIVLPRDILEDIAGKKPADLDTLCTLMKEVPWRFKHFGAQIFEIIKQEISA